MVRHAKLSKLKLYFLANYKIPGTVFNYSHCTLYTKMLKLFIGSKCNLFIIRVNNLHRVRENTRRKYSLVVKPNLGIVQKKKK
jgi:hypothetical protein